MKAFRIGRKRAGHWINKTPPIRGGYQQVPSLASDASEKTAYTLHIESDQDGSEPQDQGVTPVDDTLQIPTDSLSPPDSPPRRDQGLGTACSRASSRCSRRAVSGERRFSDGDEKSPELPFLHDVEKEPLAPKPRFNMTPKEYTEFAIKQGQRFDSQDYPSVDMDVQQAITEKYMALHQQVSDQGLYNCPYIEYGKECVRYVTIFALFIVTLRQEWYFTSALFLGLFWHQIMFTAHDAGHRAITTIFAVDTLIGMFIADFCCGLSIGWWKSSHNVHHLITNQPEHDPDIQNVPLFATCPSFFKSISSSYYEGFVFYWDAVADYMVPYQKYTYYPVMGIARFNLYLLSWLHVLSKKSTGLGSSKAWWIRPTEIAFMAGYWFVFGYLLLWRTLPDWPTRVMFVLVSHIVTMPLHVQITLSHWGMSTSDLGENESFPQRQLRTTMDVDCPAWLDFIHGGLQFQAVHHLFPRVPRHNLRKVQTMVRKFCDETEIPYSILGFVDGNRKVLSRLDQVSEQVKILASCQKYMAETGESGLH